MPSILYKTLVILSLQTCLYVHISVADSELQPGDTIGPQNWERVKGMVGENLLNRIKQGYTFKLKEPKTYRPPKEYLLATEKFSGGVRLGADGELLNYVAGLPFPKFDPSDSQAG